MPAELNYEEMIFLDAENLAEDGIGEAYESLLPQLQRFVADVADIEEVLDNSAPSYVVRAMGQEYTIYSPELEDGEGRSWGRATFVIFHIINSQLTESTHRFYAINGGNDLGGMFLTPEEAEDAKRTLANKTDWPYLPENRHPWYGQHH